MNRQAGYSLTELIVGLLGVLMLMLVGVAVYLVYFFASKAWG